jgi:hypothetical protein
MRRHAIVVVIVAAPRGVRAAAFFPAAFGSFGMTFRIAEPAALTASTGRTAVARRAAPALIIVMAASR